MAEILTKLLPVLSQNTEKDGNELLLLAKVISKVSTGFFHMYSRRCRYRDELNLFSSRITGNIKEPAIAGFKNKTIFIYNLSRLSMFKVSKGLKTKIKYGVLKGKSGLQVERKLRVLLKNPLTLGFSFLISFPVPFSVGVH